MTMYPEPSRYCIRLEFNGWGEENPYYMFQYYKNYENAKKAMKEFEKIEGNFIQGATLFVINYDYLDGIAPYSILNLDPSSISREDV